ncbi:DUF7310 family coiled-coil domain-containing protein [Halorubrum cibi]|uniref:DUF7310 domain-containing protein n=1 Tax=Halorubrum cibi TaxID=413815 RepID=A0A521AMJ6_9EURY|nr:hypothetical protein [Halorubrum cibi]SMO36025.1 hypothetical protein SAMN06264867_101259 [Halorubrum cibi]
MASETNAAGSTPDRARIEERLDAVERALTGTDRPVAGVADRATADAERKAIAERLDAIETRIEELEAATQAVRGYAGAIRAVNREVERRADLALARATAARDGDVPASEEPNDGGALENAAVGEDELPGDDALDAAVPEDARSPGDGPNGGSEEKPNPLERLREAL